MTNQNVSVVTTFNFEGNRIRVHDIDGIPWFVLADVCRVLEIADLDREANSLVRQDVCDRYIPNGVSGLVPATLVNESGLYDVIFSTGTDEAKRFNRWISSEVLSSICKPVMRSKLDADFINSVRSYVNNRGLARDFSSKIATMEWASLFLRAEVLVTTLR